MSEKSLKEKIHEIMGKNNFAVLATITDDGKPWVRYIACNTDKKLTIRFATFKNSRKVAQIGKNNEVHLTMGVESSEHMGPYLQVQGKAEITESPQAKKDNWSEGLKNYFNGPDDPNYVVATVVPYRIEYMGENHKVEVWEG